MPNPTQPMKVTFTNSAPEDEEWTAGINLLNNWTEPDRYLRHIVQYIGSGKHYPADMHVDLIKQIMEADRNAAIREAQVDLLENVVADNTKMAVVVILIASLVAFTIMGDDNVKPIMFYWAGGMFALLVICAIQDVLVKRKLRKEGLLDAKDN